MAVHGGQVEVAGLARKQRVVSTSMEAGQRYNYSNDNARQMARRRRVAWNERRE